MSWLKRLGRKILGSLKTSGRKILGVGQGARKVVGSIYNTAKKIPVVGDILDKALDTKVLGGRLSIKDIANNVGNAIEAGDKAYSGDIAGAYDSAKKMKFKKGGIVPNWGGRFGRINTGPFPQRPPLRIKPVANNPWDLAPPSMRERMRNVM
jgi:hypothetical protein